MKYAVTPDGPGKRPGLRAVKDGWPLAAGETAFIEIADDVELQSKVLAADGQSLRAATPQEIAAARTQTTEERFALIEAEIETLKSAPRALA